jgi:hypothetical protein
MLLSEGPRPEDIQLHVIATYIWGNPPSEVCTLYSVLCLRNVMLIYDILLLWHAPSPGNWMSVPRVTSGVAVAGKRCGTAGTVPPECLGHHQGIARAYFQSDYSKVSSLSFRTRQTSHLFYSAHVPKPLCVVCPDS